MSLETMVTSIAFAVVVIGFVVVLLARARTTRPDSKDRAATLGTLMIALAFVVSTAPRLFGVQRDGVLIGASVVSMLLAVGSFALLRRVLKQARSGE